MRYVIIIFITIFVYSCEMSKPQSEIKERSRTETLKNNGFIFPDDKLFKNRMNDVFGVNVDSISTEKLNLEIKPIISDAPDFFPTVFIKEKYLDSDNFKDSLSFVFYNKYIFYKDKAAFSYLKNMDNYHLFMLVQDYGYYDDNLINYIFKEIDNNINTPFAYSVFFGRMGISGKWQLRRRLFQKYLEYNPNVDVSATKFIAPLINKKMPYEGDRERDTAFILEKLIERNENKSIVIAGEVDYIFNTYPNYLNNLKENNFFNFPHLKSYYEIMYMQE